MRLFQVDKASIQVVEWYLKSHFLLLDCPKFDFGEVEKAMFQVVGRYCELIFFILTSPKCDLGKVGKALLKVSQETLNSFSAS